jgi:hypothetical protein
MTIENLAEKVDTAIHLQAVTADEVHRLGRAHEETASRLRLIEDGLSAVSATARVAIETALALKADREELRAAMQHALDELSDGISARIDGLERVVSALRSRNEAQERTLEQTLGETRLQTPLIQGVQGRAARSAAWASAVGTAFAYAIAEILRHFVH